MLGAGLPHPADTRVQNACRSWIGNYEATFVDQRAATPDYCITNDHTVLNIRETLPFYNQNRSFPRSLSGLWEVFLDDESI